MGGSVLLIIILVCPTCLVWDAWARCWRIVLQMTYCTPCKRGIWRSWEIISGWAMTGMTLIYNKVLDILTLEGLKWSTLFSARKNTVEISLFDETMIQWQCSFVILM